MSIVILAVMMVIVGPMCAADLSTISKKQQDLAAFRAHMEKNPCCSIPCVHKIMEGNLHQDLRRQRAVFKELASKQKLLKGTPFVLSKSQLISQEELERALDASRCISDGSLRGGSSTYTNAHALRNQLSGEQEKATVDFVAEACRKTTAHIAREGFNRRLFLPFCVIGGLLHRHQSKKDH